VCSRCGRGEVWQGHLGVCDYEEVYIEDRKCLCGCDRKEVEPMSLTTCDNCPGSIGCV